MATTTTNIGLTKPASGELNWATEMNANLDTLDQQIHTLASPSSGVKLVDTVTGTVHTLSVVNGALTLS